MSSDSLTSFTTKDLVLAMAPVDIVVAKFLEATCDQSRLEQQGLFSAIIHQEWNCNEHGPSHRYLRALVRKMVATMDSDPEDDALVEFIYQASLVSDAIPDPAMTGYQSFRVGSDTSNHHLKIRVFPQHNDVALKVWEAGACLAEYLMAYPDMVANKRVIELGAGVGLTGLVMAACCQPISVYMTDYSATCLENMNHNIAINQKWIQHCRGALGNHEDVVTWGFLDWFVYAQGEIPDPPLVQAAEVMVAADVTYDIELNTALSRSVSRFLRGGTNRQAVFAMTLRNKETFDSFERELSQRGIQCKYEKQEVINNLPSIFPVYFIQPRSDVRIITMSLRENE